MPLPIGGRLYNPAASRMARACKGQHIRQHPALPHCYRNRIRQGGVLLGLAKQARKAAWWGSIAAAYVPA